jgi:hypothetical protein
MNSRVHIDELVIDAGLAGRPEALTQGLRDELVRLLAAQGLGGPWQGSRTQDRLVLPPLTLDRAGGLSGEQIAGAVHAALQAPPPEAGGPR